MQKHIVFIALSLAVAQLSSVTIKKHESIKIPPNCGFELIIDIACKATDNTPTENVHLSSSQLLTYIQTHKKICALVTVGAITAIATTIYLVNALCTKKQDKPVSVNA